MKITSIEHTRAWLWGLYSHLCHYQSCLIMNRRFKRSEIAVRSEIMMSLINESIDAPHCNTWARDWLIRQMNDITCDPDAFMQTMHKYKERTGNYFFIRYKLFTPTHIRACIKASEFLLERL